MAAGLGLTVVFVTTLAGGLLYHLDTPAGHRAVASIASDLGSDGIKGSVEIKDVSRISPRGIDIGEITLRDPEGRPVASVYGAHVGFNAWQLARAVVGKKAAVVDHVFVDRVNVALIPDEDGAPSIARAVASKKDEPAKGIAESPPSTLDLTIDRIDAPRISVFGEVGKPLDRMPIEVFGEVARARVAVSPDATRLSIPDVHLEVAAIPEVLRVPASIDAHATLRIPSNPAIDALGPIVEDASVTIDAGGAKAFLTGTMDEHTWAAHLDVPTVGPGTVATILGSAPPVLVPIALTVDATGTRDRAEVTAYARLADGSVDVDARIDLGAFQSQASKELPRLLLADADVRVHGIPTQIFAPPLSASSPPITLSGDAHVVATQTMKGTELALAADAAGGGAAVEVDGVALLAPNGGVEAAGKVNATYGRNKVAARIDAQKKSDAGLTAHADVEGDLRDLAALTPFTGVPVKGSVDFAVTAEADLGAKTFSAKGSARALAFAHPSVATPEAKIDLDAHGSFTAPELDLHVSSPMLILSPANANPNRLHDVELRVAGNPQHLGVEAKLVTDGGQKVALTTHLSPTKTGARMAATHVLVRRETFSADIAVKEVVLDGSAIRVTGLRMSSTAGGLRVDALWDPTRNKISVDASSTPIDITQLSRGLGFDNLGVSGTVTLDAKLSTLTSGVPYAEHDSTVLSLDPKKVKAHKPRAAGPYLTGHVALHVHDGYAPQIGPFEVHTDVDVEDKLLAGDVAIQVGGMADVAVHGAAVIPGRLDDAKAWKDATGHVDLRIPKVDLSHVSAFLAKSAPTGTIPMELAGSLEIVGHVERRDDDAPPTGYVTAESTGLAMASGATRIDGIDVRVRAALDAQKPDDPNGPMQLYVVTEARDAKGPLLFVHAGTEGTWAKLMTAGQAVSDMPLTITAIMAPRPIMNLPKWLADKIPVAGTLGLTAKVEGTFGKPTLDLRAKLGEVPGHGTDGNGHHDVVLTTTYDGARARVRATVASTKAPEVALLALDGELRIAMSDVLAKTNKPLPWTAKVDAKLSDFPLDTFVALGEIGVGGTASGELHVDHVNDPGTKAATVDGRIDFRKLKIGEIAFDEAWTSVKVDETAARTELRLHGKDGAVDVKATVPLAWAGAGKPSIATGAPIEAYADVRGLRLKLVEPFIAAIDDLDGVVDAHVEAKISKRPDGTWDGSPVGKITLRDGIVVADAVGERWDNVTATVDIGKGRVDLRELVLKGRGGEASASGYATLDGFFPKTFHVQLDTKRFATSSQGARVGELSGRVILDGKTEALADGRDRYVVDVTLAPLTIDLAAEAGKDVQDLDDDPSIVIAQPIGPPIEPPAPPGSGIPMVIRVKIPNAIWIRRDDLRIAVTGNPSIDIDGIAKFSGEVRIEANEASSLQQRSWVEVLGKRFYIQASRVAFAGNEDFDPSLDVKLRWQAPDRTIVEIRVTGHMKTPKVDFVALDDSGRPTSMKQGEIMSLLVFGRREAGSAQQQQQAEQGAAQQTAALVQGMTGAIVGRQLQKVLPTSMSLSLSPGRYSGGYQHKNVYFEVAYHAGGARMGPQAIGQTQPRTTFGIEWRFAKMWSLMTTIGDTGSTLVDLLWHYRY